MEHNFNSGENSYSTEGNPRDSSMSGINNLSFNDSRNSSFKTFNIAPKNDIRYDSNNDSGNDSYTESKNNSHRDGSNSDSPDVSNSCPTVGSINDSTVGSINDSTDGSNGDSLDVSSSCSTVGSNSVSSGGSNGDTPDVSTGDTPDVSIGDSALNVYPPSEKIESAKSVDIICDVWKYNLEAEFVNIRKLVKDYEYVAMDTEFPGVVGFSPEMQRLPQYQYHIIKTNVDRMRLIQLGLTFMNEEGEMPSGCSTWQFNFKFDLDVDIHNSVSINMLKTCGLQFDKHRDVGIEACDFADLLISSGIVLFDNIKWICYQSGYDFGYLIKILTGCKLPTKENDFFEILTLYCPVVYDIKYLTKSRIRGGLQDLADMLAVERIGARHQAGSDALVTGKAYFKLIKVKKDIPIYNCVRMIISRSDAVPLFVPPNVDISRYRYK